MVLINKQPKLSCRMASMSINDSRLIKRMRGSRNFRQGGGGPGQSDKKSSDNGFFFFFFFFFFLVLSLFNRSQMVNVREIYHFSRFQRGSNIFQGAGSNFFQGGPILYSL